MPLVLWSGGIYQRFFFPFNYATVPSQLALMKQRSLEEEFTKDMQMVYF